MFVPSSEHLFRLQTTTYYADGRSMGVMLASEPRETVASVPCRVVKMMLKHLCQMLTSQALCFNF